MLENDGNSALTTIREVCSISLRPLSCSKIPAVTLRSEVMHSLAALCPLSLCPHRPPLSSSLSRSQPGWLSQVHVRSRLLEQLLSLPITLLLQISEKVHCLASLRATYGVQASHWDLSHSIHSIHTLSGYFLSTALSSVSSYQTIVIPFPH